MSVSFFIKGQPHDEDGLNMANGNAADVLEFLGYMEAAMDLAGEMPAKDIYLRCEQALASPKIETANKELVPFTEQGTGGAWLVNCGRRSGYVGEKVRQLMDLARQAGDLGWICFG